MYVKYIKRINDLVLACLALIILSPIILFISILVRIKIGSPIFFIQSRVGKDEKTFQHLKFRTMTNEKDVNGNLLPNELRITKLGEKLRAASLDELPQLINVIRGEMSLVGPRPLPVEYLRLYNDEQKKRHQVKPGLTNISAITGRNKLTWEEKFEKDVLYLNHISFLFDCEIMLKTIFVVLKREGITSNDGGFRPDFKGSTLKDGVRQYESDC